MDRPDPILHREHAHSIGGRDGGRAMPDAGGIALAMAIPKAMGGTGEGSNPEQLFALGYATCFNSALLFVARSKGVDATKARVACEVAIGKRAGGGFALAASLTVSCPGIESAQLHELVEAAHQVCPYSNATRGNIEVTLKVA